MSFFLCNRSVHPHLKWNLELPNNVKAASVTHVLPAAVAHMISWFNWYLHESFCLFIYEVT